MPTNLHALIRYRTIDECLRRTDRRWSVDDLSQACGEALRRHNGKDTDDPSRRMIFYDLRFMKDPEQGFNAPIEYIQEEQSYRYTHNDFSIFQNPLQNGELEGLRHALNILRQFRGFHHLKGLEHIITKLEHTMLTSAEDTEPVIQFDHPADAPGQEWLNRLFNCIRKRQSIQLTYQPFHFEDPADVIISPYLLKEYNQRWFLLGFNHKLEKISTFALDRIRDVRDSLQDFRSYPYFQADTYFNFIIGVSIPEGGQVEEVRLAVYGEQAMYLYTKPLHPSQRVVEEDGERTVFSYQLIPNDELESLILSFGERAEVLAPEELREQVKRRGRQLWWRY